MGAEDLPAEEAAAVLGRSSGLNVVMPARPAGPPGPREIFTYRTLMDGRTIRARRLAKASERLYPCLECGRRFATSSNLSRHTQVHRDAEQGVRRECKLCHKQYGNAQALQMHMLTHRPRHACGVCGRLFARLWSVRCHMRCHTDERPYGCAHCGRSFNDRNNLRCHMRTHKGTSEHGEDAGLSTCQHCHKAFSLHVYLVKHLVSCGPGEDREDRGEDRAEPEGRTLDVGAIAKPRGIITRPTALETIVLD